MRTQRIVLFLFFLWLGFNLFFGEHILANNGLGWDGVGYARMAQNIDSMLINHEVSSYKIQRIFPSLLIFSLSKGFHFTITNQNAPFVFSILNAGMLILSIFLWNAVARKANWDIKVRILSFAGLFLNFVNLKMAFYYPVLTDTTAFTIGLAMIYCYISRKNLALILLSVVGAWTFPTLLCMGMVLFIFPIRNEKNLIPGYSKIYSSFFSFILAISVTVLCLIIQSKYREGALGNNYSLPILSVSGITLFLYLFFAAKPLIHYRLKTVISSIQINRFLLSILIVATIALIIHFNCISSTNAGLWFYLIHVSNQALAYPLNFMVSHIMYYGATVILLIYFWKEVTENMNEKGPGLIIVTAMCIVLSIGSESRQLTNFLPLIVIMVAEVLNKKIVTWNFVWFFTLLNLIISRFWLPLNHGDWPSLEISPPQVTLEFPLQWYFMNLGPWLSHFMYWIFSTTTVFTFFCAYIALKRKKWVQ